MTSHVFHGVRLPDAVAGHPALDFCNTRAGWGEERPKEYLSSVEAFLMWCLEQQLLRDETVERLRERVQADDVAAEALLDTALELRDAVHDVALGERSGRAWEVVAGWAQRARAAGRLVPAEPVPVAPGELSGSTAARWELDPESDIDAPLLAVAHAVDDLLTSPLGTTVGSCPGHGCGWLFTDRRRRRRWCSMAACGNREKVRRHAERARQAVA